MHSSEPLHSGGDLKKEKDEIDSSVSDKTKNSLISNNKDRVTGV
jgi:hypothetical protein